MGTGPPGGPQASHSSKTLVQGELFGGAQRYTGALSASSAHFSVKLILLLQITLVKDNKKVVSYSTMYKHGRKEPT